MGPFFKARYMNGRFQNTGSHTHTTCTPPHPTPLSLPHVPPPPHPPEPLPLSGLIQQTTNWWFFSYFSQKTGFLHFMQILHEMSILFSGKNMTTISICLLLKILPRVLSVNVVWGSVRYKLTPSQHEPNHARMDNGTLPLEKHCKLTFKVYR